MFQGVYFENTDIKHRLKAIEVTTESCFLFQSLHRNFGFSNKGFKNRNKNISVFNRCDIVCPQSVVIKYWSHCI